MEKEKNKYEDILNLPHHVSNRHAQMSLHDRAAQFAPFAALTGHGAAILETARMTDKKPDVDENVLDTLDSKIQMLMEYPQCNRELTVTYFIPDQRKAGGAYVSYTGSIKRADVYQGVLVMDDDTVIKIHQIINIEGKYLDI